MLSPDSSDEELRLGFEKLFLADTERPRPICFEKIGTKGIRIVTWNVAYFTDIYGDSRYSDQIKVLKDMDPDILCLQSCPGLNEIEKYYAPILTDLPHYHFSLSSENFGNLIFSRYPILAKEIHALPAKLEPRSACNVKLNVGGTNYSVWCLELDNRDALGDKRREALRKLAPILQKDSKNQWATMIMGTLHYINPEHYTFNEMQWYNAQMDFHRRDDEEKSQQFTEYKTLKGLGFMDAFIMSNQIAPKATCPEGRTVDMILFSQQMRFKRNWVYRVTPSRHFPVVCDIYQ